jgi:WbqC-like protein family
LSPESQTYSSAADERIVAIHQPNFLPWLGYFDKLARADVFILLDCVQFPMKGGTWMNRVRLLISKRPAWITVPIVRRGGSMRSIRDTRIDNARSWRANMLRTIEQSYARAPFFDEVMPQVARLINAETDELATFNEAGVRALASALCLDTSKIIRASSLNVSGSSTDLLIALTKAVDGTAYLCGGGARGYQEDEKFPQAGIRLLYQGFQHPTYPQLCRSPEPGLSIVDAMMGCGSQGAAALLTRILR